MPTVVGQVTGESEIGVFGESARFEGVRGVSHAGDSHGGVVGINDNTSASAGPGVFGKSSKGAGVWGNSDAWYGLYGESQQAEGIRGQGHKGAGVSGLSEQWIGSYGESRDFEGVRGVSHAASHGGVVGINDNAGTGAGPGLYGKSAYGAGVYGTSDHGNAGFFEGIVVVTGDLKVGAGISIIDLATRLVRFEQQIGQVQSQLAHLNTGKLPPNSGAPLISVSGDPARRIINVTGSGFTPNHTVTIRLVQNPAGTYENSDYAASTGPDGAFTAQIPATCISSTTIYVSATDSRPNKADVTGVLWSNVVTSTCP